MEKTLYIELLSETTFGSGESVSGLVDQDVTYDPRTGFPFVHGRTLKGLLVEACADLLYALKLNKNQRLSEVEAVARLLFGVPGSTVGDAGRLMVGSALLPLALRQALQAAKPPQKDQNDQKNTHNSYPPTDILEALTTIRRQTAMDEATGAAARGSLRASRVLLRELTFEAPLVLDVTQEEEEHALALLAACAAAVQRAGSSRNRGRGRVACCVGGPDEHKQHLDTFADWVRQ
ncbi:RAMP superfamily CRISPR-associated protein [Aggregatilineales bacterium SYSU G02658]